MVIFTHALSSVQYKIGQKNARTHSFQSVFEHSFPADAIQNRGTDGGKECSNTRQDLTECVQAQKRAMDTITLLQAAYPVADSCVL